MDALFAAESVPPPRLPVLLALLEGRPDLEQALVEAGLPAAAAAVLRSDLLQRLLPGGLLLETLMGLVSGLRAGRAGRWTAGHQGGSLSLCCDLCNARTSLPGVAWRCLVHAAALFGLFPTYSPPAFASP